MDLKYPIKEHRCKFKIVTYSKSYDATYDVSKKKPSLIFLSKFLVKYDDRVGFTGLALQS